MTDNEPSREELNARTDDRHRLGTDAKGRDHYVDAHLGVVWVTADDSIEHIEQTSDVSGWVAYTRERVGWQDCRYSDESIVEWLDQELARMGAV